MRGAGSARNYQRQRCRGQAQEATTGERDVVQDAGSQARKRRGEQPLAWPDELDRLTAAASAPADEDALLADSVSHTLLVVLELRGASEVAEETRLFAQRARAGVVGIVIAPHGRAPALLLIGVGADNLIHTIDITGDAERIRRTVVALPHRPSQYSRSPMRYQGHQKQPAGQPATGEGRNHHAR